MVSIEELNLVKNQESDKPVFRCTKGMRLKSYLLFSICFLRDALYLLGVNLICCIPVKNKSLKDKDHNHAFRPLGSEVIIFKFHW